MHLYILDQLDVPAPAENDKSFFGCAQIFFSWLSSYDIFLVVPLSKEQVPAKHQQCWFRILLLQDQ
jgi:hypothetical protein